MVAEGTQTRGLTAVCEPRAPGPAAVERRELLSVSGTFSPSAPGAVGGVLLLLGLFSEKS